MVHGWKNMARDKEFYPFFDQITIFICLQGVLFARRKLLENSNPSGFGRKIDALRANNGCGSKGALFPLGVFCHILRVWLLLWKLIEYYYVEC